MCRLNTNPNPNSAVQAGAREAGLRAELARPGLGSGSKLRSGFELRLPLESGFDLGHGGNHGCVKLAVILELSLATQGALF